MPVSVQTPEDSNSKIVPATERLCLRPGLRVAAVIAAIGGMASVASGQDTFDGEAGDNTDFNDPLNWLGNVDPGTNLGGETIIFDFADPAIDAFTILVTQDIFQIGDLDNTADNVDITFDGNGVGTFEFIGGATINPGEGSFTFDLDVTALGDLNFSLADGNVTFNQGFTTNGGIITADGGVARFNGTVTSGAGTRWTATNDGGFRFDGQFNATGNQTFNIGDGTIVFNGGFDNSGGAGTIVADGGVADFNGTVTSTGDTIWEALTGGFRFTDEFDGTGNQTFSGTSGTPADDSFNFADVTFTNDAAGQSATFQQASFVFSGDVLVAAGSDDEYGFSFDGATVAMGGLTIETSAFNLILTDDSDVSVNSITTDSTLFDLDLEDGSKLTVSNSWEFTQDDATLAISSAPGGGELVVNGATAFGDRSSLTVDDASVAMNGSTAFGDSFSIDATGNDAEVTFGSVIIGGKDDPADQNLSVTANDESTVTFGGGFSASAGISDIVIGVNTDATGTVKIDGSGLRGFTSKFEVSDNSNLVFNPGSSGDGGTSLALGDGATVSFGDGGAISNFDFLFAAVDDLDTGDQGRFLSDLSEDVNIFIRGGTFGGTFEQTGTGKLSMNWAVGESRFNGEATTAEGDYWVRNEGVHYMGTEGGDRATVSNIRSFKVQQATAYLENADVTTKDGAAGDDPAFHLISGATSTGNLFVQGDSSLTAQGRFQMEAGSLLEMTDNARILVTGTSEINGGTINLTDTAEMELAGEVTSSNVAISLSGTAALRSSSAFNQTNGSISIDNGATMAAESLVLDGTATLGFIGDDTAPLGRLILNEGMQIGQDATLFGNGEVTLNDLGGTGQLDYEGVIRAGAAGATTGYLKIDGGDVVAAAGGRLEFGIDTTMVMQSGFGQSSLLEIGGTLDLSNSGSVVMDVTAGDYIPSDIDFKLISAGAIQGDVDLTTNPDKPSVTRTWDVLAGSPQELVVNYAGDYTNTLTPGTSLYQLGTVLNDDFQPLANQDPTGAQAELLGELDMLSTAAAYQAALEGLANPTVQISAVQVAALSQYHDVLRNEIRRKFTIGERRTPTPFRLGESFQLAAQDDVAGQAIRRQMRPESTAQSFGAIFGRNLTTPTDGIIIGLSGNEYGGLGGFGWDLSEKWTAGVDLGYSAIMGDLDGGFGSTRVGTLRGGGFVTYGSGEGLFADLAISGGWNHYDFTRSTPGISEVANSNADGFQIDTSIGLGYRIGLSEGFALTPTGSFLYSYINTGSIDESSTGPIAQSVDPGDLNSFIGRLGADLSWTALPGLVIDGRAGWQGNFTDNGTYNVSLVATGTPLPVDVPNQTINTAYYGLGVNWNVLEEIDLNFRWEGRSGEGLTSQMFMGGMTIRF